MAKKKEPRQHVFPAEIRVLVDDDYGTPYYTAGNTVETLLGAGESQRVATYKLVEVNEYVTELVAKLVSK